MDRMKNAPEQNKKLALEAFDTLFNTGGGWAIFESNETINLNQRKD
jgi:hypothetical protein